MKARLHKLWQSRSPRERVVVVILGAVLGVALYLWLVQSASRARGPLLATVTALRAEASRLEQEATQYERLRQTPRLPALQSDVRTLVQTQAGAAGLALARVEAPNANEARVAFAAVAFADWLAWVASLQSQKIRLDACRIEALPAPGLVNVTATFIRAGSQ